jgi:hypothetical protein
VNACYFDRAVRRRLICLLALAVAAAACHWNTGFERLIEARRLTADLLVQFLKSADAGNRAVMADTDEASMAFAREARQATELAQNDAGRLAPLLQDLGFTAEIGMLDEFRARFAQYRTLDRDILDLAVENTNLKAQRLSFSSAQQAADAMRDSLDAVMLAELGRNQWQVAALARSALASAREIQVLEAPHIAEAGDAEMTRLEKRMTVDEGAVREALRALGGLVNSGSRPHLSSATAAFERLVAVNGEIVRLSRRNTNVRSLALSLNQKRTLTAECEASLRALQDALAKRGFAGTR